MILFSDARIIVMYKVKNCPNMVKAVFFEKDKVLQTKRQIRCRKLLLSLSIWLVFPDSLPTGRCLLKGSTSQ
jgi:hypothetical protein